jgi:thiol-disulfide isomerase/thioredoxin
MTLAASASPRWRHVLALLAAVALAAPDAHAVDAGAAAPPFALPDARGETVALALLRGQVVYVDFWASWCPPCRRSFPWMNELQQRYGSQGFTVVAINVDKKREDAQRFLAAVPATFPVLFDPAGRAPEAYAAKAMPSSYLVDARGEVVLVELGFRDERKGAIEDRIRALLERR